MTSLALDCREAEQVALTATVTEIESGDAALAGIAQRWASLEAAANEL